MYYVCVCVCLCWGGEAKPAAMGNDAVSASKASDPRKKNIPPWVANRLKPTAKSVTRRHGVRTDVSPAHDGGPGLNGDEGHDPPARSRRFFKAEVFPSMSPARSGGAALSEAAAVVS